MRSLRCFALFAVAWFGCTPAAQPHAPALGSPGTPPSATPVAREGGAPKGPGSYATVRGLRMYYEVHGHGPPLLVLHGGMSCIDVWPEAIAFFSRDYQVIAPEQMGHGRTADDPSRPMDYHAMAEDTAELLRQLKVESAYVLGWSDGGILGLDLAMNHAGLVRKLAVSGANFSPSPTATGHPPTALGASADVLPSFLRQPYERLSPDGPAHWQALYTRVRNMWITGPDYTPEQLARIHAPTLIVAGDHDFARPAHTVEMARRIAGSELWIVPDSTHGVPKKRADLFNATVKAFFEQSAPQPAAPAAPAAEVPKTSSPSSDGRYANVRGVRMYYEVHGQGAPLVLLHGGAQTLDAWRGHVEHLAKRYRVIAPEQMGHGRTRDDPSRAFHYHDMAEQTAELLRQLQVSAAYFVGRDDGAVVGLDLAMSHAGLVKKLVVSGARFRTDAGSQRAVKWLSAVRPEEWSADSRRDYERLSADGPGHWPIFFDRLKAMWASEPSYTVEQLGSIKSRTLVALGDRDVIEPEHAVALFQAIPGAELLIAPNSEHDLPAARPALFDRAVEAFLEEPEKPDGGARPK